MNWSLLWVFTRQDLVDRYSTSLLGGTWTLISPLVQILIYTLIFSRIMGARLDVLGFDAQSFSYSVYLVPGILAWTAFSNTMTRVSTVFLDKAGIIGKVSISLRTLPVFVLLAEAVIFAISIFLFACFLLLIDFPITLAWLWMLPIFAVQQLLAYSLGFLCAVLGVFVRDLLELLKIVVSIWFWLTPIVYVTDILSADILAWLDLNPMLHLVAALRDVVLLGQPPDLVLLAMLLLVGLGVLLVSVVLLARLERELRDFL